MARSAPASVVLALLGVTTATVAAYECRFTPARVTIDGSLDEAAWTHAAEVGEFSLPWLGPGHPARTVTRARLLWDRDALYVAADMDDGDLHADITEHDGRLWENDVFEVFLKPATDEPGYYEFEVNARNTQFDCFIPRRGLVEQFKNRHEFGIESAVRLRGTLDERTDRDEGWSVEIRIPWASLRPTGGRPQAGDEWRFALCRYDYDVAHDHPELSSSAPLSRPDFHRHEEYQRLVFEAPPASEPQP
jgi:hypothetical protein